LGAAQIGIQAGLSEFVIDFIKIYMYKEKQASNRREGGTRRNSLAKTMESISKIPSGTDVAN
jgi:hypothetical protein